MYKKIILSFIGLIACLTSYGQCNIDSLKDIALARMPKEFVFSKSYKLQAPTNGRLRQMEYTCVMTKGTTYCLGMTSADGEARNLVVKLFDKERNELATNYSVSSSQNQQFGKQLIFNCQATGIYYLSFSFKGSQRNCGFGVLGFKIVK